MTFLKTEQNWLSSAQVIFPLFHTKAFLDTFPLCWCTELLHLSRPSLPRCSKLPRCLQTVKGEKGTGIAHSLGRSQSKGKIFPNPPGFVVCQQPLQWQLATAATRPNYQDYLHTYWNSIGTPKSGNFHCLIGTKVLGTGVRARSQTSTPFVLHQGLHDWKTEQGSFSATVLLLHKKRWCTEEGVM